MKLLLQRERSGPVSTLGRLFVDGVFECYTLEDVVRERAGVKVTDWKIQDITAIGSGTFRVVIDFSDHFQRILPHILAVPGFTGVRMHSGNDDKDTDGCVLVGRSIAGADWITDSRAAFDTLFAKLEAAAARGEEIWITIENPHVLQGAA